MNKKDTEIKDRIQTLKTEQEDRVKTVEQLNTRISEMREGIAQLKEAHDYTRGQLEALESLVAPENDKGE
ncbi:hypothetical protein H8D85_00900 [bacterium]|nr:hypothetical protein [bacterium]